MKRLIWLLLICAGFAQTTPNLHLNIPPTGQLNWGPTVNANFTALDSYLSGVTPLPTKVTFSSYIRAGSVTFATLPSPVNGGMIYCSDCQQVNPCASGGTGALAQGINGAWQCAPGSGGSFSGNATSIQGVSVDSNAPSANDVFQYNGTTWTHNQPSWVPLTGGTMTGTLVLNADPTVALGAATKQYVDNHSSSGGAGVGSCTNQVVTAVNTGTPTCKTINSGYVDSTSIEILAHKNVASGYIGLDASQNATVAGAFSIGGLLNVAGAYYLTSPLPAGTITSPSVGLSAWGFESDGYMHMFPGAGGGVGVDVKIPTQLGAITAGHAITTDANGNLIDNGTAGSGNISGSALTTNKIPKATGAAAIGDSSITDDGTTVTSTDTGGLSIAGNLSLTAASPQIVTTQANASVQVAPNGTGELIIPAGSATSAGLHFNTDTAGAGLALAGTGGFGYTNATSYKFIFGNVGFKEISSADYAWVASTSNANGSVDTGVGRIGAGVVSADTSGVHDGLGKFQAAGYNTSTNCAAAGTAANPSAVACSAAPSGAFSCATNASGGTCVVSTTAVTSNSNVIVQQASYLGTRLSVTCNTGSALPAGPLVTSISAGTSFTITLGTFSTNPACFVYWIVN